MHEMKIAQELLQNLHAHWVKQPNKSHCQFQIQVGEFSGVDIHALEKAMQFLSDKSIFSELPKWSLVSIKVKLHCQQCHFEQTLSEFDFFCNSCGSRDVIEIEGRQISIYTVKN